MASYGVRAAAPGPGGSPVGRVAPRVPARPPTGTGGNVWQLSPEMGPERRVLVPSKPRVRKPLQLTAPGCFSGFAWMWGAGILDTLW